MAKQNKSKKKGSGVVKWIVGGVVFVGLVVGGVMVAKAQSKKRRSSTGGDSGGSGGGSGGQGGSGGSSGGGSGGGSSGGGSSSKWLGNGFPLQPKSNGSRVRRLQQALIAQFGQQILPKYGADGYWGSETTTGLQRAGWPTYYANEGALSLKASGSGSGSSGGSSGGGGTVSSGAITNFHDAAWNLHQAGKKKNWSTANGILSRMHSTADYMAIRKSFIQWPFRFTANYTPVSAMALAFPSKQPQLHAHWFRMGLRQGSNGKWTVPSVGSLPMLPIRLRMRREGFIWSEEDIALKIPAGMVVGQEVRSSGGFTEFINGNGDRFFVHTSDVQQA